MKIVIAIGGNALVTPGTAGDIADQFRHSRDMARPLADLIQRGWQVTVTHGNAPQVGNVLRRVELASSQVYPIDLGLAVADTQAGMGYMISQTLRNELRHRDIRREVTTIVTSVLVDAADSGFRNPTKPIGPWLDETVARRHAEADGWTIIEDAGRGWRRVVASPRPLAIEQIGVIRRLVDGGELLVACGGGGIPVVENDVGERHGVEAVIDKDLTSAILAAEIGADVLALLTGVSAVYLNYRLPDQKELRRVRASDLIAHMDAGHFAGGSMLPKIQAAMDFLKRRDHPEARAIVTNWSSLFAALDGDDGTTIVP